MLSANTIISLVIGNPVKHSLSPKMHNHAYFRLGLQNEYVFLAADVKPEHLSSAIAGIRALNIRGCSVTIPHKCTVIPFLNEIDPQAKRIGSVNTIVNCEGHLKGYNTDYDGFRNALERQIDLSKTNSVVLGAGGAARAAILALKDAKSKVSIVNRTVEKGEALAKEFEVNFSAWGTKKVIEDADVIINCTSLGLKAGDAVKDLPIDLLRPGQIVFDAVYTEKGTEFGSQALAKGCKLIDGLELLATLGQKQFCLYTGQNVSYEIILEGLRSTAIGDKCEQKY